MWFSVSAPVASDDGQSESGGLPGIGSLLGAQKALGGAIADVRTIAESVRLIPDLVRVLTSIEKRVTSMEQDVSRMRNGVDGLGIKVDVLDEAIEQMLEPLAEIGLTLHPLRRGASRISRIGRRGAEPADGAPPPAEPSSE